MRASSALLLAALVTAATAQLGCLRSTQFRCTDDRDCLRGGGQGVCETVGYCSFEDGSCPEGRRYGSLSGPYAGVCVGDEPPLDGGVDGPPGDAPPGDGPPMIQRACALTLGSDHTCVHRFSDGSLWCYGSDADGQLGNGSGGGSPTAQQVNLGQAVVTAATRSYHTCAGLADGTARCWGRNDRAQIGDGTNITAQSPTTATGVTGVVEVLAARGFSCARRMDGSVTCWGENDEGELGDGTFMAHPTAATTVVDLPGAPTRLSVGGSHACATFAGGAARCWGSNDYGELGDGMTMPRNRPIAPPVTDVAQMAPGSYNQPPFVGAQTCALKTDGTIWCWGSNDFGQLGNGTMTASPTPVQVMGVTDGVELTMGRWHGCVRRASGAVACWGRNNDGAVGDGTMMTRSAPVAVTLPRPALHIEAGGFHTCALLDDQSIRCWGRNANGQLGDGTNQQRLSPVMSTTLCQ